MPGVLSHPLLSLAWPTIRLPLFWASTPSSRPLLSERYCAPDTEDQYGSSTVGLITKRLYSFPLIWLPYDMVRLFPVIGQPGLPLCSQHLKQCLTKKALLNQCLQKKEARNQKQLSPDSHPLSHVSNSPPGGTEKPAKLVKLLLATAAG